MEFKEVTIIKIMGIQIGTLRTSSNSPTKRNSKRK